MPNRPDDLVVSVEPRNDGGERFLLVKRGLYYRPDNCGYTGFKERAGRYDASEADEMSGVTAIHEDEADEIAPGCFDDLARDWLNDKLSALRKENADLTAALERTWEVLRMAGLGNLANGVQLGQVSWFVKISDAEAQSLAALKATPPQGDAK